MFVGVAQRPLVTAPQTDNKRHQGIALLHVALRFAVCRCVWGQHVTSSSVSCLLTVPLLVHPGSSWG